MRRTSLEHLNRLGIAIGLAFLLVLVNVTAPFAHPQTGVVLAQERDEPSQPASCVNLIISTALAVSQIGMLLPALGSTELATSCLPELAAPDVVGVWSSEYGQVLLIQDAPSKSVSFSLAGVWQQPPGIGACPAQRGAPGCLGIIERSTWDPETRTLALEYYEEWLDLRGSATLKLSPDGTRLEGAWQQPGASGTWLMKRRSARW